MNKAGKEGKPRILGLFDYRVTPQSGSIASPLQLLTQHTPKEKNLPQLPSALSAPEMHQTHQAECYMGTSNSGKPMCTKLLLDHAGEWYRATKCTGAPEQC